MAARIQNIDTNIFKIIYNAAQARAALRKAAKFITKISRLFFNLAYVAAGVHIAQYGYARLAVYIIIPLALMAAAFALRQTIRRPRPLALLYPDMPAPAKRSYSFPSNHAAASAVITAACAYAAPSDMPHYALLVALLGVAALAAGLSRVCVGLHWPSDVLAGWALGCAFGAVFLIFL